MTGTRLTCYLCCRGSQKYNHEWDLQQLREVWTKTFKSSVDAEDDVQEDDVEMTVEGGSSGTGVPADEDPFGKQMCLGYESQVRVSTVRRYDNPQALDQLEEWMKEKPVPYISNDKFSQEDIFRNWTGCLSGYGHVNRTYPDVVRMWRQFHGCLASGGDIKRSSFQLENSMMLSRKVPWTGPWKAH